MAISVCTPVLGFTVALSIGLAAGARKAAIFALISATNTVIAIFTAIDALFLGVTILENATVLTVTRALAGALWVEITEVTSVYAGLFAIAIMNFAPVFAVSRAWLLALWSKVANIAT
jgi:hypothetical protein